MKPKLHNNPHLSQSYTLFFGLPAHDYDFGSQGAAAETCSLAHLAVSCVALMRGSRGRSFHAGSGEVIAAAAIDRYVWYGSAKTSIQISQVRGERKRAAVEKESCSRKDAHQDARPALCQSHQTCIGTLPETRRARGHLVNDLRQGSDLAKTRCKV